MHGLTAAAQSMAAALSVADLTGYVECLNASRLNHYALHPSCDSDILRQFFAALAPYIDGGKTCGAGGGGFIFVHMKPGFRRQCIQTAQELGGRPWSFAFDHDGLRTWEAPPSDESEIASLAEPYAF